MFNSSRKMHINYNPMNINFLLQLKALNTNASYFIFES